MKSPLYHIQRKSALVLGGECHSNSIVDVLNHT